MSAVLQTTIQHLSPAEVKVRDLRGPAAGDLVAVHFGTPDGEVVLLDDLTAVRSTLAAAIAGLDHLDTPEVKP